MCRRDRQATDLKEETSKLFKLAVEQSTPADVLFAEFEKASPRAIAATLIQLASTGSTGARLNGVRDSARAILDIRLADRLDKSSTRLQIVGWCVTGAIGLLPVFAAIL
jgi:hypothetical protein